MEPDVTPVHAASSPPLLDDDGDLGADDDEFGDFGSFSPGVSCSTLGFTSVTESPSSLRQRSPTVGSPATHPLNYSFNYPVEQSQPMSTVKSGFSRGQVDFDGQRCNAEPPFPLRNGYPPRDHASERSASETQRASEPGAGSPWEEPGFADFTAFTEQTAHPWCCGFSPTGDAELWDGRAGRTNLANSSLVEQRRDSGQEIVTDSESGSKAKENDCTTIEHCEQMDASPVQPSQDHQPQEPALASPHEEPHPGGEQRGTLGDSRRERRPSASPKTNSSQPSEFEEERESEGSREDGEESGSTLPHTASVYESVSEDGASFCDVVSPEGRSEYVSLSSSAQEDETDEEEEEPGHSMHADSPVNLSRSQSEADECLHLCDQSESATQETSVTSNPSESETYAEDRVQTADGGERGVGRLPPSDSFADFCSAAAEEDGDGCWGAFRDQEAPGEEGHAEEERDRSGRDGAASLSCRVMGLLQASFPEVEVPSGDVEEEEEEGVPSLGALLQTPRQPEDEEEEEERAQWVQRGVWWQQQDVHNAVGLRFQWGGSHAYRTLLGCLGVDTRNIVFTGPRKQPVVLPAFASSLGMLEPTRESAPAVGSPRRTVVPVQRPPGPQGRRGPATDLMLEALPSSQLDWSSSGLTNSQDGSQGRKIR